MQLFFATLMLFAGSIVAPIAVTGKTNNQQQVLSKQQKTYANDIDPFWDCDLPTCQWGPCEGALRYSMRHASKTCIKSFHSLTNGDW
jgi:hypothetical protein